MMIDEKKFLVDVGIRDLPFPMRVVSKADPDGQATVADISVQARIMHDFSARWIDRFIQIIHRHKETIGTASLCANIGDYLSELNAGNVRIDFSYPYFVEKRAPVSGEANLVRHKCTFSARIAASDRIPRVTFAIEVPCISTYPGSVPGDPGGLFGQLSFARIEVASSAEVYPEDLVALVDKHALAPVYAFLSEADQEQVIKRIHSENISSVVMTDHIRNELSHHREIDWYAVRISNHGMLHPYSTMVGTEKSWWVPDIDDY